ncbi:MAG: hypothetical protein IPM91_07615 [Bacteroidetes bacterium]|nr:hypothetical protein [Bacteroidota bacterium]
MKTKAKFVVLMVLIVILNNHYTHAQWNFNGDAVGSVTSIGPTTNYDFPFITNNTEKLRIKTTGEVGIGTTTPSSWLHVENTSEDEMFRTNGATGSLWRMLTGGTARFNIFHSINGTDHNIQMESTLVELRLATTTSQPMLFYTNNVERIRIPVVVL